MSARLRRGFCNDPGPGEAHCTEQALHRYSCYDATEDVSWNDGQFADGAFDGTPHECSDTDCPGRPAIPTPTEGGAE